MKMPKSSRTQFHVRGRPTSISHVGFIKKKAAIPLSGLFFLIWAALASAAWGQGKGTKQDCDHCKEPSAVLAVVNGQKIYESELEEPFHTLEMNLFEGKKKVLDQRIDSLLFEEEARRRKLTPEELMKAEMLPQLKPVTEEDARKFYDQNRAQIRGEFKDLKDQIMAFLRNQDLQRRMQAFASQLRKKADVKVLLTPPEEPTFQVSADDDPIKGNKDAPLTITEFSDYQ